MKLSTVKNKIIALSIFIISLITFGEIIIDKIWGDGDGAISITTFTKLSLLFSSSLSIFSFLFLSIKFT
jgi:hypothetical protein